MTNKLTSSLHNDLVSQLSAANKRLRQLSKILADKDRHIDCLESDLENILDQLDTLHPNADDLSSQWITRPVPGLNAHG